MNKAVFLDKDGTVIKNVHYNANPARVELEQYAGTALRRLQEAGFKLVIISNQAGVSLGYFTEQELAVANNRMIELLKKEGVKIDALYYCPHHIKGVIKEYAIACDCRKPAAGMLLKAADDQDIILSSSWMAGDILDDIEAGHNAGCYTILVNQYPANETKGLNKLSQKRTPDHIVINLKEMADIILSYSEVRDEQ